MIGCTTELTVSIRAFGTSRIRTASIPVVLIPSPVRALDPAKDMGDYGYGSVVWKDRLEAWKQQQGRMHMAPEDGAPEMGADGADLPS